MRAIEMRAPFAAALALSVSLASAAASAAAGPVAAARHHGMITGDTIRWTSNYRLREDEPERITLAFPLPAGATIEVSPDVAPITREGRVIALRLLAPHPSGHAVVVTVAAPFALDRRAGAALLSPPLAAGEAVQLVDVAGGDDLRFEPAPRTGLARHVGFFAPIDLPPSARDACDRAVGYTRVRAVDDPMYLVPNAAITTDEGIRGMLVSAADRLRTGALGAGGVFVAIIAALVLLQRKLARAARVEQAEKALAAEFAELDGRTEQSRPS